jgi:hypothetical protein
VTNGEEVEGKFAERNIGDGKSFGATVTAAGSGSGVDEVTIHSDACSP